MRERYGVMRAESPPRFAGLDRSHLDRFASVLVDEFLGRGVGPGEHRADQNEDFGFGVVEGSQRCVTGRYS